MTYYTPKKLLPFIGTSLWKDGFKQDKPNNFWAVYDELFRRLDREEEAEELVGTHHTPAPYFGNEDTPDFEVKEFYQFWENFVTIKPFAYKDLYDPKEAPNRRIKRIIETENDKERKKEKKKYNDTVKKIVEFIKAKDPRIQRIIKAEIQEKKEKARLKKEEEERKREEHK